MRIVVNEQQLADINALANWRCGQDFDGVRIGGSERMFAPIDARVAALAERVDVKGLSVLEIGCLEGCITAGLCNTGAHVTALDARPECALKTFLRCLALGFHPTILLSDARDPLLCRYDIVFHAGVLYHLADPVAHFRSLCSVAPIVFLDTHTARPGREIEQVADFDGEWYAEYGWTDEFSGLEERSFWLTKESLYRLIDECGFDRETIKEDEGAENGPRGWYLLRKR
ncbi:MAG: hypothetical protein KGL39_29310 [Patescibacteria group bacterium]|nr:hypothetical protein [Patescibacteria group bacterium]